MFIGFANFYRRFIQRFQQDRRATHLEAQEQRNRHPIEVVVDDEAIGGGGKSNEKSSKTKTAEPKLPNLRR